LDDASSIERISILDSFLFMIREELQKKHENIAPIVARNPTIMPDYLASITTLNNLLLAALKVRHGH